MGEHDERRQNGFYEGRFFDGLEKRIADVETRLVTKLNEQTGELRTAIAQLRLDVVTMHPNEQVALREMVAGYLAGEILAETRARRQRWHQRFWGRVAIATGILASIATVGGVLLTAYLTLAAAGHHGGP